VYTQLQTMKKLAFIFITIFLSSSCYEESEPNNFSVTGMKPIYIDKASVGTAESEPAREFDNLGKIVTSGPYIYITEVGAGIHVLDNTDPTNPQTVHFWSIPGNKNFTIKDDILYADNSYDLLTVDIAKPDQIKLLHRSKDFYGIDPENNFPAGYFGFFECVDRSKGAVIDWEEVVLMNPKCRR